MMKWVAHVSSVCEMRRSVYTVLIGKPEWKIQVETPRCEGGGLISL
jgi:hypothetical protein